MSYFEMQQEAWFKKNCQGRIEDCTEEDLLEESDEESEG